MTMHRMHQLRADIEMFPSNKIGGMLTFTAGSNNEDCRN